MGEVIIKPVFQAYLIPGVYFAPEVSLNTLFIDLLKQQGFEVVSDGDRYRLEYMFKEPTGNILDLNKLRQMQNNFLEDYFEGLDENQDREKDEMVRVEEDMNSSEVHTFHEFVAFLNLIKNDELLSKGWDLYRDKFVKLLKWFYNHYLQRQLPGYLSVHFGQEFSALAEILGLTRKGEDIRKCYMVYLDIFTSYYKTARAPEVPTKAEKDSSLESYQWNIGKTCAPLDVQRGKEKLEHFGIKLEEEEVYKEQQHAYCGKDQITCYRCHNFRYYAHECPNKRKDKGNYTSYKEPSTDKGDSSRSNTSKDFTIIT
nr:ARID DNA-binding domain-containing protein [Tanacetum cinerariifolium]